jgi:hypothetical protein
MTKDGVATAVQALVRRVAQSFLKQTEYIHSMFDVECSMFDVLQFFFDQAARSATSGWPDT